MLWAFLCQRLPWHRWVIEKALPPNCRKLICSCGRQYGVNDHLGIILPWDKELEEMHEMTQRILALASEEGKDA
jgi:hypothetical protein